MMKRILLLGLVAFALGCNLPTWVEEVRVVGVVVGFQDDDPHIVVPDTVQAGADFTVSVRTYGGGCERQGSTELEVDGLGATVTPYDITLRGVNVACTAVLKSFTHKATLRFVESGTARVTVRGREGGRAGHGDGLVTFERTVVVRQP